MAVTSGYTTGTALTRSRCSTLCGSAFTCTCARAVTSFRKQGGEHAPMLLHRKQLLLGAQGGGGGTLTASPSP
jgi:hypothetical protein